MLCGLFMLGACAFGLFSLVAVFPERHELALTRVAWDSQPWLFGGIVAFEGIGGAVSSLYGIRVLRETKEDL